MKTEMANQFIVVSLDDGASDVMRIMGETAFYVFFLHEMEENARQRMVLHIIQLTG